MFGINQPTKRRCRICANIKTQTAYGVPVCYEIRTLDGKPAATEVSLNDDRAERCHKFIVGKDAAPDTTVTFSIVRGR